MRGLAGWIGGVDWPHPPAPSPTFGEGVDCGLRRNDGGCLGGSTPNQVCNFGGNLLDTVSAGTASNLVC